MPNLTLVQALQIQPEELHKMQLAELAELHSVCSASKQKKARLQADIIAGVINAKKKELKAAEPKQEELELVPAENSAKPKLKAAGKTKPAAGKPAKPAGKPAAPKKTADKPEQPAKQEKPADEPKKPKSLKRAKKDAPNVKGMSKEELEKLAMQLINESSRFPQEIAGANTTYKKAEFETIQEIQKHLMDSPMSLYIFADERLDDNLTQFLVLFANAETIVLFDRNRQKNTTITIKAEQLEPEHIVFDKTKFEYSFYIRTVNEKK